jgi:hypothetical protein
MSDDLVTWLRAQLDADEQVALAVKDDRYGDNDTDEWKSWAIQYDADEAWPVLTGIGMRLAHSYADNVITPQRGEHIALWDPARALAEIDAKRQLLDESAYWESVDGPNDPASVSCGGSVLAILALPYADRPGYREEWRP